MEATCLNCEHSISEKYCSNCGQKTSTHRYSLKHFVEHDFVHGVWHVDKGILFTIKELFTRPGHSVREFVLGKRANYFSFITLLILILGISSIISQYTQVKMSDLMPENSKATMNALEQFTTKYPKLFLLIIIPITSLFSLFWFRKAKYNYSEHLVLNSYLTAAGLIVGLLYSIITIFYTNIKVLIILYYVGIQGFSWIYAFWFYHQFFSQSGYSKRSLVIRSIMAVLSPTFLSMIVGVILGISQIINK